MTNPDPRIEALIERIAPTDLDRSLTPVDRLRLYNTDTSTFHFDFDDSAAVEELLDDVLDFLRGISFGGSPTLDEKAVDAAAHVYRYEGLKHASERPMSIDALRAAIRAYLSTPAEVAGLVPPAVLVKPLEWREQQRHWWVAATSIGFYYIEERSASDSPYYKVTLGHNFAADRDGLSEAKAAAQADYETRIRSALSAGAAAEPVAPGTPTWAVRPWGDGSSLPGHANIVCDAWEMVIFPNIPIEDAQEIVTAHNRALAPTHDGLEAAAKKLSPDAVEAILDAALDAREASAKVRRDTRVTDEWAAADDFAAEQLALAVLRILASPPPAARAETEEQT